MKLYTYAILLSFISVPFNLYSQLVFEVPLVISGSGYFEVGNPIQIEKGDFNGDGQIDFVYGTEKGLFLFFMINEGNGKYAKGGSISTGYPGYDMRATFQVIDSNQDGLDEVIATSVGFLKSMTVVVRDLNGNSSWVSQKYNFGEVSEILVNDFNGDAKEDFLVISPSANFDLYISSGNGFELTPTSGDRTGGGGQSISVDLNADTNMDLVVSSSNAVYTYLGNSNGAFMLDQTLNLSGPIQGITSSDFSGDGLEDIIVSVSGSNSNQLDYFVQSTGGSFIKKSISISKSASNGLEYIDINNDGKKDIVLGASDGNGNSLMVLTNLNNDTFSESSIPTKLPGPITDISITDNGLESEIACVSMGKIFHTYKIDPSLTVNQIMPVDLVPANGAVADLNNDLLPDLITINAASNSVAVSLNKDNRLFNAPEFYQIGIQPVGVSPNDFNEDGYLDIAYSTNAGLNDEVGILLNDGTGKFLSPVIVSSTQSLSISSGDLNSDQKTDLMHNYDLQLNQGNGSFSSFAYSTEPSFSTLIKDLDGDGFSDIVYDMSNQKNIVIKYGSNVNPFQSVNNLTTTNIPTHLKTADLNNDGGLDLVASNDNGVSIYWNRGNRSFQEMLIPITAGCGPISTGDLNNDGTSDLAVFTPYYVQIILGNSSEQLSVNAILTTLDEVVTLEISDVDVDNKRDIIAWGKNRINIYRNNLAVKPTTSPTNLLISNLTDKSASISWTRPHIGDGQTVLISKAPINDNPVDGVFYQSTLSYLTGNRVGGSVIVYSGTDVSNAQIPIYGLEPDTEYFIKVVDFDKNHLTVLYGSNSLTGSFKTKKKQSIYFNGSYNGSPINDKTIGDPSFSLNFVSSSGLPLTYTCTNLCIGEITIEGDVVTLVKAGFIELEMNQEGNNSYAPAKPETVRFCINPPVPIITITNPSPGQYILTSNNDDQNKWLLNDSYIPDEENKSYVPTENGVYSVRVFVGICYNTSAPTPQFIVGLENESPNSITPKLFPNPFSKIISMTLHSDEVVKEIYLTDALGWEKMVTSYQVNSKTVTINLENISNGLYYVKVITSKNIYGSKVIKSHH